MAVRTVTQFKSLYGTAGSLFPDNTTGLISEADIRSFGEDIADSFFNESDDTYTAPFPQVTATGTDTYAATLSPAITAYATGQKFQIKFTNASSGVSTLNLNAVGAKKIFVNPTTQATVAHIVAGQISLLVYDTALDAAAGGFLMIGAPTVGGGTVTAVTGTTNRITSSGGATPAIDIDAAYDAAVQAYADGKVANSITNGVTTSAPNQDQVFDALAGKETAGAAAALLTTTITNGDTTHAPDGNAVFDALALKSDITYVDAQVATKYDILVTLLTYTASHTLDATDLASVNAGDQLVIRQNVASANNLEIPLNATQAFPVGTVIGVRNMNTGVVTITAVGGVTLTASLSAFNLSNQWDMCYIEKTATNTWVANGQLSL